MNKVLLKNDSHIFQMLGAFDDRHGYALPKDIAEILIKMPKKPVVNDDEIDVGTEVAFLQGNLGTEFCIEGNTLYLIERAAEMAGLVVYTYLVPLVEMTPGYFKNLDAGCSLAPLKARINERRKKYLEMLAEHERLAQKAIKQLTPPDVGQFKRFIRRGKLDFCCAQLQYIEHTEGENEVINRWKTACGNKTAAMLVTEPTPDLFVAQIKEFKKKGGGKKGLNFKSLLAALKKDKPKKQPKRILSDKKAAELLNGEAEIEDEFKPEEINAPEETPAEKSDSETQQIVKDLLGRKDKEAVAMMLKTSFQSKKQVDQSRHAPAASNSDREQ